MSTSDSCSAAHEGRYRIGWRIIELNQTLQGTVDVKSCASPVLQALSDEYGETTHLAILERYRVFYVDKVVGNHIINITGARVGPISMLTAAPSAKYSSRTATATRSNAM